MLCQLCGGTIEAATSAGLMSTILLWFFRTKAAEVVGKAVIAGSVVLAAIDYAIWEMGKGD